MADTNQSETTSSPAPAPGRNCGGVALRKGPWTEEEDEILKTYVERHGGGCWNLVERNSGLSRCGKSCRLRWNNHLRPNLRKGPFTPEEEIRVVELHALHGNKWALMATQLKGRTDNEIKNFWNTRRKRLQRVGKPLYPPEIKAKAEAVKQRSSSAAQSSAAATRPAANSLLDYPLMPLPQQQLSLEQMLNLPLPSLPMTPRFQYMPPPNYGLNSITMSPLLQEQQQFSVKMEQLPSSQLFPEMGGGGGGGIHQPFNHNFDGFFTSGMDMCRYGGCSSRIRGLPLNGGYGGGGTQGSSGCDILAAGLPENGGFGGGGREGNHIPAAGLLENGWHFAPQGTPVMEPAGTSSITSETIDEAVFGDYDLKAFLHNNIVKPPTLPTQNLIPSLTWQMTMRPMMTATMAAASTATSFWQNNINGGREIPNDEMTLNVIQQFAGDGDDDWEDIDIPPMD